MISVDTYLINKNIDSGKNVIYLYSKVYNYKLQLSNIIKLK